MTAEYRHFFSSPPAPTMVQATTTTLEEADFDLFGELTPAEEAAIETRKQRVYGEIDVTLKRMSNDPRERTVAENRFFFDHVRHGRFQVPQTQQGVFSPEECRDILNVCRSITDWTTERHSAFPTTDIPVLGTPLLAYLPDLVRSRLLENMARHFGFHPTRDLDFRDIFIVKYAANAQKGLEAHTDGCLMSFNILLSHPDDFQGGGTWFESTNEIMRLNQGDALYHDARITHRGVDISKGERYILVGFVDTKDTVEKDKLAKKTGFNRARMVNKEDMV